MRIKHFLYFIFLLTPLIGFSQTVVDIDITKDAFVETRVNDTTKANTNFGTHALAPAHAWTAGGNFLIRRYIFDIDLSGIPANSIILSADLYLFSYGIHDPLTKPNDASLKEITGSWDETGANGITWNKHLNLGKTGDSLYVPGSDTSGTNDPNLDYIIDINSILSSNFQQGQTVTTFRLQLNTEEYYARLMFCSSDHSTSSLHPFVRISYAPKPSFAVPMPKLDGNYYKCRSGWFNIKIDENYYSPNGDLDLSVYDNTNSLVYQVSSLNKSTGVNLYEIDLKSTSLFTGGDFYVAKILDEKGNIGLIRFQYNEE